MALNISAWSIRNPLPSIVFSIILLVLGWVSFTKLAVTRLPSADIPVISVAVSQFGAAPAELESQVTKTIEDGVSGVEGVRHISSSITDGLSLTTIQFALETNTDRALNDVKDAVTRVRSNLPQNVNEPLIQRVDVIGLPIVTYAAISPGKTPEQLSYFVDDVVKRALQGVRNVAQVERIGGVEREILVSLDPDRLQAAGLTAVDVSHRLRGTNVDLAGGRAEIGKNDQAIRTLAGAKTPERSRRHHDQPAVRRRGAARRSRHRHRHHRRPPDLRPLQRRTGGGARHQALQGRQRRGGRRRRAEAHRRAENCLSRCRSQADRHLGGIHQGQLRGRDLDPVRRRDSRRHHRAAVPARYQGHHHRRDLAAAVDLPGVLGDGHSRLLAQPGQLSRHHAVDRYSGRRRHRRDREHRAPHADGQIALSRGAGGRRRNRPRRDRDLADHHRDLRACELHVRHRRAVLQAIRHHGFGAGVLLAARRALRHAGAGGLLPEGSRA